MSEREQVWEPLGEIDYKFDGDVTSIVKGWLAAADGQPLICERDDGYYGEETRYRLGYWRDETDEEMLTRELAEQRKRLAKEAMQKASGVSIQNRDIQSAILFLELHGYRISGPVR